MRRVGSRLALIALLTAVAAVGLFNGSPATAVELPPAGSAIFIQTNGPNANIGLGDWYSASTNGVGGGYHYVGINVPCSWPPDLDMQIDLFSPEMNTFAPRPRIDEDDYSAADATFFELYGAGTTIALPNRPGPGDPGSVISRTYQPVSDRAERWERFHTLAAPVTCGAYVMRVASADDSENGWRLRFGADNDADPNNEPPPNYDNPDSRPGSGDEPSVSIRQTTYQHTQVGQTVCLLLYQFVKPGLPDIRLHNFDLDNNVRVTYYPPSAELRADGTLTPGAVAGTVSGFSTWNQGTLTSRGAGDLVLNPEPGWWRLVTCVQDYNQFNQEGITGEPTFRESPPEPDMVLSKDDGRTVVGPGDELTYTISFFNQSLATKPTPGAAFNPVLTDTLPPNTTYRSCSLGPGLRGSCQLQGGQVIFTLDDPVFAGEGGAVQVTVAVNQGASGQVTNAVALDYIDVLNNPYPTKRAEDTDTIQIPADPTPALDSLKSARLAQDANGDGKANPGEVLEYTITVQNTGLAIAKNVSVYDEPDPNTGLLAGSVRLPQGGTVLRGNRPGDRVVEANLGSVGPGASASVVFQVMVGPAVPPGVTELANQGVVRGDGVPFQPTDDPSTPAPDDPTRFPFAPPPDTPTAVTLLSFSARPGGAGAIVRWETGMELGTAGFEVLRASGPDRSAAVSVSSLIPARGQGGLGAVYTWEDAGAGGGASWHYWLVEHEQDGGRNEYGPARLEVARPGDVSLVHLPLLGRP
jgi:uncharacterized repeat protein (TIGR01451 family)